MNLINIAKKYIKGQGYKIHSQKSKNINVSCPICKEGNSPWKHRGYFIFNSEDDSCVYYCFNCMSEGMSIFNFLKEYTSDYDSFLKEVKATKIQNFKAKVNEEKNISSIFDLSTVEREPETSFPLQNRLFKGKLLIDDSYYIVEELSQRGCDYVHSRGFSVDEVRKFKETKRIMWIESISTLIFPFWSGSDSIYGYQGRSIEEKRFYNETFDNPKVYGLAEVLTHPPESGEMVYIFESIFNGLSTNFKWKLVMLGKTLNDELLRELVRLGWTPVFCFDNDLPGKEMAIKYSGLGFMTLVHDRKFPVNDFNDALKSGVSKEAITSYIEKNICTPRLANKRLRIG